MPTTARVLIATTLGAMLTSGCDCTHSRDIAVRISVPEAAGGHLESMCNETVNGVLTREGLPALEETTGGDFKSFQTSRRPITVMCMTKGTEGHVWLMERTHGIIFAPSNAYNRLLEVTVAALVEQCGRDAVSPSWQRGMSNREHR